MILKSFSFIQKVDLYLVLRYFALVGLLGQRQKSAQS